jgi:hypothetical protein
VLRFAVERVFVIAAGKEVSKMWFGILIMSGSVAGLVIWIVYAMKGDKEAEGGNKSE